MPTYQTQHLDFENATIDDEGQIVINRFVTVVVPNSDYKYSGQCVAVKDSIRDIKRYTLDYISEALEKCIEVSSPRLQEWQDLKDCYDALVEDG